KMPACFSSRTSVHLQELRLFGGREFGSFPRIEANGKHVELLADIELQNLQRLGQPLQYFTAQHRALKINQIKDQRPLAKIICQTNRLSCLIAELKIRRNLLVEMLLEPNIFQSRRTNIRRRRHDAFSHPLTPGAH